MHSLADHPSASTVEAHGRALVGNPNLLIPACTHPFLKMAEQQTPKTTASAVWSHDHALQPRRAVLALLNVELS